MRKKLLFAGMLSVTSLAIAQVGVNTPEPKASFDITAKNPAGRNTSVDGVLIPRVDRERAQNIVSIPTSTLIYVNDISTGTQSGIATNIDFVGYYYFDGKLWIKLNPSISGKDEDNNIYNTDGALLGNRIVTIGDKTLSFVGNKVNAFSVNDTTLSVDALNNRVGIGIKTPLSTLMISNSASQSNNVIVAGYNKDSGDSRNLVLYNSRTTNANFGGIEFVPGDKGDGLSGAAIRGIDRDFTNQYAGLQFFTRNSTGFAPRITLRSSGNVGIGTTEPAAKLHVQGSQILNSYATATSTKNTLDINIGNDGYSYGNRSDNYGINVKTESSVQPGNVARINFGDTHPTVNSGTRYLSFSVGKNLNEVMYMTDANGGNVGVGTSAPNASAALDVSSTDKGFLPPRLTTAQRNAIANKPAGLMIYNTDTNCMNFWNSSEWVSTCAVAAPSQGTITTIDCASVSNYGTLTAGTVASGVSSSIPYTGGNGGSHGGQTVISTGVTGLTATLSAGSFANGNGAVTYTITGTPSASGTANFAINIGGKTCTLSRPVSAAAGAITSLNCGAATNNGTLTAGTAASGVSSSIPYTGGNGGSHNGQTVASTGVTGLTATLSAGSFANGSGSVAYTITGTPTSAGTATFAINIGGQSCTLTRAVTSAVGSVASLDCANATTSGTLAAGTTASGVTSTISYTGGNGGSHNGQTVASTGVTGLTATLSAGSFANGNGTVTYTITGMPTNTGYANFAINIGGKTCTLSVPVDPSQYICGVNPPAGATNYYAIFPTDKTKYYRCVKIGGAWYYYLYQCPAGNHFNPATNLCTPD